MKKLTLAIVIMALSLTIGCNSAQKKEDTPPPPPPPPQNYSDLVVNVQSKENTLNNIKLMHVDENNTLMPAVNGTEVKIRKNNHAVFFVDLSETSKEEHIKLVNDMNRGMKVFLVVVDESSNREIGREQIGIKGFRTLPVITLLDENKDIIITTRRRDEHPETIAYQNDSQIPVKVDLNLGPDPEDSNAFAYVELNYDEYSDPANRNVINGNQLVQELSVNPSRVVQKDWVQEVHYQQKYKNNPRKTDAIRIKLSQNPGNS